jgi:hypothetical protein
MPIIATRASAAYGAGFAAVTTVPYLGPFGAYDSLATATLSSSADFILFSEIPTGYKHLELRMLMRSSRTEANDALNIVFNGDTSSYPRHYLMGSGSATSAYGETTSAGNVGAYITSAATAANAPANVFAASIVTILDYTSTAKYKTIRALAGGDQNGSGDIVFNSALWMSTSAITSIKIQSGGLGDWVTNSTAALYGVR